MTPSTQPPRIIYHTTRSYHGVFDGGGCGIEGWNDGNGNGDGYGYFGNGRGHNHMSQTGSGEGSMYAGHGRGRNLPGFSLA